MATIDVLNLREVGDEVYSNAQNGAEGGVSHTDTVGIDQFSVAGTPVLVSSGLDVDVSSVEAVSGISSAMLIGNIDADMTGTADINFLVANDGDNVITAGGGGDFVSTGAGDDQVNLGAGDDYLEIDGSGTKVIESGEGDDVMVILPSATGEDSHTTITDFNDGDSLRLAADANGDGEINLGDFESIQEDDGNTTLTLVDGTTVVLEGVTGLNLDDFEVVEDGENGDLYIDIT